MCHRTGKRTLSKLAPRCQHMHKCSVMLFKWVSCCLVNILRAAVSFCGNTGLQLGQRLDAGMAAVGDPVKVETEPAAATAVVPVKPEAAVEREVKADPAATEPAAKKKLPPKRKVAMHLAYLGKGYHGMQRNPGFPTIEADLEKALVAAGAISDQNAGSFMKIHWMRAARTDKGVSAACQVVSAKLMVEPADSFADRINALLPQQIRVFGVQRTTDGFDARKYCDKRKYEYILPAWVFDPDCCSTGRQLNERDTLLSVAAAVLAGPAGSGSSSSGGQEASNAANGAAAGAAADGEAAADASGDESAGGGVLDGVAKAKGEAVDVTASSSRLGDEKLRRLREDVLASKSRFTFGDEQLQRLNRILGQYEGTQNFHNYTVRVSSSDPAARRYILSFTAELKHIRGDPWVKLVVVGQSFMLHQIRKMVGMAVAVMRGTAPEECLRLALDPDRDLNTPMAPALGLFLDETYFDAYNNRFGELHGPVTFEPFRDAAESFKAEVLYPDIAQTDDQELINALWLRTCTEGYYKFSRWSKWGTVRNTAATIAANRAAEAAKKTREQQLKQAKRAAEAAGGGEAAAGHVSSEPVEPASKQQRVESGFVLPPKPWQQQVPKTAAMVVAAQETYGMSLHKDTQQASEARQELNSMREEYNQILSKQQQRQSEQQQQQQEQKQQLPEVDPAELDSLYDME